jgi:hypothetical protein
MILPIEPISSNLDQDILKRHRSDIGDQTSSPLPKKPSLDRPLQHAPPKSHPTTQSLVNNAHDVSLPLPTKVEARENDRILEQHPNIMRLDGKGQSQEKDVFYLREQLRLSQANEQKVQEQLSNVIKREASLKDQLHNASTREATLKEQLEAAVSRELKLKDCLEKSGQLQQALGSSSEVPARGNELQMELVARNNDLQALRAEYDQVCQQVALEGRVTSEFC